MKEIITAYNTLKDNMALLIDSSGYRNDYLADKTGIKKPHFYVKKKRGSWTDEEMMKILSIIDNDQLENIYLAKLIDTVKHEEHVSYEELRKELNT